MLTTWSVCKSLIAYMAVAKMATLRLPPRAAALYLAGHATWQLRQYKFSDHFLVVSVINVHQNEYSERDGCCAMTVGSTRLSMQTEQNKEQRILQRGSQFWMQTTRHVFLFFFLFSSSFLYPPAFFFSFLFSLTQLRFYRNGLKVCLGSPCSTVAPAGFSES